MRPCSLALDGGGDPTPTVPLLGTLFSALPTEALTWVGGISLGSNADDDTRAAVCIGAGTALFSIGAEASIVVTDMAFFFSASSFVAAAAAFTVTAFAVSPALAVAALLETAALVATAFLEAAAFAALPFAVTAAAALARILQTKVVITLCICFHFLDGCSVYCPNFSRTCWICLNRLISGAE